LGRKTARSHNVRSHGVSQVLVPGSLAEGAGAVKHGGHATNELLVSFNLVATVMVIIS